MNKDNDKKVISWIKKIKESEIKYLLLLWNCAINAICELFVFLVAFDDI